MPSYKALQAEIETLIQEKNSGYNDYRAKREEYRRLQTAVSSMRLFVVFASPPDISASCSP